jgi:uncharacterized protein YkwD
MVGIVNHVRIRSILIVALAALLVAGPTVAPAYASTARHRLFVYINRARARHGLPPVGHGRSLHIAAQRHSSNMISLDYFAHTSPSGSTLYSRVLQAGFVHYGSWWAGETLAWGTGTYGSPRHTVRMWMHSAEHRAILLSANAKLVGIGRARGSFLGYYGAVVWTADFAHR